MHLRAHKISGIPGLQNEILQLIQNITPFDEAERSQIEDTVQWIESGEGIFRIHKPDVPAKHLVSYFILVDSDEKKMFLIDHIKAQLWLPAGGHVKYGEHPEVTVEREIVEELGVEAEFLYDGIFFLTQAVTVGLTAGHTDVSLWYVLKGNSKLSFQYDRVEFNDCKWFGFHEILEMPVAKLDPHLHRFVNKWLNYNSGAFEEPV